MKLMHRLRMLSWGMPWIVLPCLPIHLAAQDNHPSHRLIETPHVDLSNLQQQVEMLQRLQTLINRARLQEKNSADGGETPVVPGDLEKVRQQLEKLQGAESGDLEKLRQLLDRAGIPIPPGNPPDLSALGQDLSSLEKLRDQQPRPQSDFMRSLLERFADQRAGTGPQGPGRPPLNDPPPVFQDDFADPDDASRRAAGENGRRPIRSRRDPATSRPPFDNDASQNGGADPSGAGTEDLAFDRSFPQGLFGPGSGSRRERPPADRETGPPGSQPDWFEMLRAMSEINNGHAPGVGSTREPHPDLPTESGIPTLQSGSLDSFPAIGDAGSLRELQRNLQETWKGVVDQARQQSREQPAADAVPMGEAGDAAGMRRLVLRAIEGISGNILEQARNFRGDAADVPMVTDPGFSRSERNQGNRRGTWPVLRRFTQQANNWIADISLPPDLASDRSPSTPASDSSARQTAATSAEPFPVTTFAWFLLVLGLIVWLVRNRLVTETVPVDGERNSLSSTAIRDRRDVVRAFHVLTVRSAAVRGNWWSHRRAAEALVRSAPDRRAAVLVLADLYEQARYLPDEADLNEMELEAARRALQHCGVI